MYKKNIFLLSSCGTLYLDCHCTIKDPYWTFLGQSKAFDHLADHQNYILEFQVFPGERISFMAVAYGQRNGTTPATVRANLFTRRFEPNSERSRLGVFDNAQDIGPLCAELNYTIFSVNALDILNLYPDGPCSNLGNPFNILVRFRRPCPYGFSFFESEGVCICEERLQQYTNSCDISQQTISRSVGSRFLSTPYSTEPK